MVINLYSAPSDTIAFNSRLMCYR